MHSNFFRKSKTQGMLLPLLKVNIIDMVGEDPSYPRAGDFHVVVDARLVVYSAAEASRCDADQVVSTVVGDNEGAAGVPWKIEESWLGLSFL